MINMIQSIFAMVIYEGCSFNSGTNAPLYHMAVRNLWKLRSFHQGVVLNNGPKFFLNLFNLLNVIES